MYVHWKDTHTACELEKWAINKDVLDYGMERIPDNFV